MPVTIGGLLPPKNIKYIYVPYAPSWLFFFCFFLIASLNKYVGTGKRTASNHCFQISHINDPM